MTRRKARAEARSSCSQLPSQIFLPLMYGHVMNSAYRHVSLVGPVSLSAIIYYGDLSTA